MRLDRTRLTVAESAILTITTTRPEGVELAIAANPEAAGGLALREERREGPTLTPGNLLRETVIYRLVPFLPGEVQAPPLTVASQPGKGGDASPGSVTTDPVPLTVTSVLPAGETAPQLREPGGPVTVPDNRWWLAAGLALCLAALLGAGLWYLRARRQRSAPPPPPVPPQVRAREALAALLAAGLLDRGEAALFITRVSEILRRYIEERFGLAAPERTTEEFLSELAGRGSFSAAHRLLLADFLTRCDLVKFAGQQASGAEAGELAETLRRFLDETAPPPGLTP